MIDNSIKPTELKTWFKWDGMSYYGQCKIGHIRCFFIFIKDIVTSFGEWVELDDGTFLRENEGFRLYHAYEMTAKEYEKVDLWYSIYNQFHNQGDETLKVEMEKHGLNRYSIINSVFNDVNMFENIRKTHKFVAEFYLPGLEYDTEYKSGKE